MNETVEGILPYERDLFFALNGSDSIFLDNVMWTITGRFVWVPLLLFIAFLFFYKTPVKQALLVTLVFILLFVLCDQVSSSLFKPLFERLRPTHHPLFKDAVDIVRGYRAGGYGFISGHATNSFGLAVFLSLLYKNRSLTIGVFLWALLNSYSRIYLGVHFISDVVGGMIVGTLLAVILYALYVEVRYRLFPIPLRQKKESAYSPSTGNLLALTIFIYLAFVVALSPLLAMLPH